MTQDEFDDLIQEIREEDPEQLESEFFIRDKPLKEDKLAKLEQKAGFTLPEEYRNFLKRFGAGDIGTITVLSPDPESDFSLWKGEEPFEKVSWVPVVDDGKSNFLRIRCRRTESVPVRSGLQIKTLVTSCPEPITRTFTNSLRRKHSVSIRKS